jgi:glycosyltransferase involved in cell wall biosynthesis
VWGNDFTLHGLSTPLMRHYTQWAMEVADALHADCRRDIRLARQWGFATGKPVLVVPGNGGIRLDQFHPPAVPVSEPILLNPRGFRAYVRNDVFFRAIPRVLEKRPEARFLCSAMAGDPRPLQWMRELGIEDAVQLLPLMEHDRMADLFRSAQILVSPTVHDGTPNSLLEGMACGCLPVAGDLESIREWITPGENGLLFDARDSRSMSGAMLAALENENLRASAAGLNREMLASRAEYGACMAQAQAFYERVIRGQG